jgi:hypothetical protein
MVVNACNLRMCRAAVHIHTPRCIPIAPPSTHYHLCFKKKTLH